MYSRITSTVLGISMLSSPDGSNAVDFEHVIPVPKGLERIEDISWGSKDKAIKLVEMRKAGESNMEQLLFVSQFPEESIIWKLVHNYEATGYYTYYDFTDKNWGTRGNVISSARINHVTVGCDTNGDPLVFFQKFVNVAGVAVEIENEYYHCVINPSESKTVIKEYQRFSGVNQT